MRVFESRTQAARNVQGISSQPVNETAVEHNGAVFENASRRTGLDPIARTCGPDRIGSVNNPVRLDRLAMAPETGSAQA